MATKSRKILKYIFYYIVGSIIVAIITHVGVRYVLKIPAPRSVVPDYPPNENNRVFSENGLYSLICPLDWKISNGIIISFYSQPKEMPMSGLPQGGIFASCDLIGDSEINNLSKIHFQEKQAYFINEEIKAKEPFPESLFEKNEYRYSIFFQRGNHWFELKYLTNKKQKEMPPPMIWEYFNTFRIENASTADDQD